jgi:hypothetical protein
MDIKDVKTLAGLTLAELAVKLDEELPKDAYKAVPGAANLTDIDPNYMRKVFNEVFGLCGVGWGYSYNSTDMQTETQERKSTNGKRLVQLATLKHLRFWYKLVDTDGREILCEIDASGGSENSVEGYAMKGAITNALGNAASNIGFQESVYLGKRDHKTVGAKKAAAPAASKSAVPAAKPAPKAVAPAPTAEEGDDPAEFVIPVGQRRGQRLVDIPENVVAWYATQMTTGGDETKESLKSAAAAYLKAKANGHEPASIAA